MRQVGWLTTHPSHLTLLGRSTAPATQRMEFNTQYEVINSVKSSKIEGMDTAWQQSCDRRLCIEDFDHSCVPFRSFF